MLILPRVQVTQKLLKNIRFRNLYGHKILMKCVLIYGTDVPGFHHALLRPPTYTTWTVLLVQHSYLNHVHQTYITPITKPLPGLIQLLTPTIGNFFPNNEFFIELCVSSQHLSEAMTHGIHMWSYCCLISPGASTAGPRKSIESLQWTLIPSNINKNQTYLWCRAATFATSPMFR